ncbi:prokaryotic phospholipase A2-domain-containing protein [Paraphoma chrysanthemicola]|uniref:Prokaryotic phospholipase A2-domain-containing protein n=1 Tax=Paraphoma chrysanthemicola TaxID=798071 RepID=A0A8K0VVZ3_9PLEO|nr:prokaryotic phospholipase A2-domain-containing protein [Paraphoma chrysanthemicola]
MKSSALITILSLASLAISAPTALDTRQSSLQTTTDNYLFSISISQFITNRNGKIGPAELDWSSDGCSSSPDNPFGFDFINSCYRHDFGYRNYKKQARFTDAAKARIDNNFKQDMLNQCKNENFEDACEATATVYYEAVKAFGKKRAVEILEARRASEEARAKE